LVSIILKFQLEICCKIKLNEFIGNSQDTETPRGILSNVLYVVSKCDGRVWCVDVGMPYGVINSKPEVQLLFFDIFTENMVYCKNVLLTLVKAFIYHSIDTRYFIVFSVKNIFILWLQLIVL
jgi:hypothetical protein